MPGKRVPPRREEDACRAQTLTIAVNGGAGSVTTDPADMSVRRYRYVSRRDCLQSTDTLPIRHPWPTTPDA